jgi:acetolactate synthase-1/2/3 large subunit
VNSYVFAAILSEHARQDDTIVTGNSLDAWSIYQAFRVKRGQRVFTNINFGAMGWDLPAVVGACVARNNRRTILVTGDGSVQFNIQELQTIWHNSLCVKIFVFNNRGYASIRTTQEVHFAGHRVGSDTSSGVSTPELSRIAHSYGLDFAYIGTNDELDAKISEVLRTDRATICEVNIAYDQGRTPRVMSRRREDGSMESGTLENMFPFLPPEEVKHNMSRFMPCACRRTGTSESGRN